ncbi:MAG: cyclooxygenase [Blastococcus sp.]|jgi:prostaglandin-endoperoxide synthase 2|nr:cyclooxygenase [Blastococcus sp.]
MPLIPSALIKPIGVAVDVLRHVPFGPRLVTSGFVSLLANSTAPRPRPLTMVGDYASWISLTDRTFSGRHLPPAPADRPLPTEAQVLGLFRRPPGGEKPSDDTTLMFAMFAQWFTDSFLRTERSDWRKNTSTQEIDFCQIYGISEARCRMLRSMEGGRLKSQHIDGQEYPPNLFERTPSGRYAVKPEFKGLHDEDFLLDVLLAGVDDRQKDLFFAVGLEHGNSTVGSTALDVLFVREHNRIAGVLAEEYAQGREQPAWDPSMSPADLDERIFQTTRMIMIVLELKIVVEEYIRHIAPYDAPLRVVPGAAAKKKWNRPSWIAVEFNLLYRWHMLIPDQVTTDAGVVNSRDFLRDNNQLLLDKGIEWLMAQCSRTRAGRVALFNTPAFLTDRRSPEYPAVEERSIALMRFARLETYNAYRRRFGLEPKTDFADLTSDVEVQRRLAELYGDIDHLEWYVGIWAEDHPGDQMMGDLLTAMVGYDAFTQALTNPLLAPQVFTEATFTRAGMQIIRKTRSLQQILTRNAADPARALVRFTYGPERRSWLRRTS